MFPLTRCYNIFLIAALLFCFDFLKAQDKKKVDSLLSVVSKHSNDSSEVNTLNELSAQYNSGDLAKGLEYAKQAVELAQKIDYKRGILLSWNQTGNLLNYCGQYDEALKYYQKETDNALAWGFRKQNVKAYTNIANVYRMKGNHAKAVEIYMIALREAEKDPDKLFYGQILNYIGMVYEDQGNIKKAGEYFKQTIAIFSELKDSAELAKPLVDLGNTYGQFKKYDSALIHYKKALALYTKYNNYEGVATALGNMGIAYAELGDMEGSYKSFKASLDIELKNGNPNGACISYLNLANFYAITNNLNKAIESLQEGIKLATQIHSGTRLMNLYELLSDIYSSQEKYEEAYRYHVLFTQYKDSVLNDNNARRIAQLQAVFDSEKKEAELEKRKTEIDKQSSQKMAFGIGLLLAIVLLFFVIRGYIQKRKSNLELSQKNQIIELQKREVETQKELIEEKQKEILDSITYARRIQRALLTNDKYIDKNLKRIKKEA